MFSSLPHGPPPDPLYRGTPLVSGRRPLSSSRDRPCDPFQPISSQLGKPGVPHAYSTTSSYSSDEEHTAVPDNSQQSVTPSAALKIRIPSSQEAASQITSL